MISKLDRSVSSISSIFNVRMMMFMLLSLFRLFKVVADPSPSSESDDKMMGDDAGKRNQNELFHCHLKTLLSSMAPPFEFFSIVVVVVGRLNSCAVVRRQR